MSVIAVGNVPLKMNVITVVKLVARQIKGFFEAINFGAPKNGFKICYLKLSPSLDPHKVVQSINDAPDRTNKFGKFRPQAFIPKYVPHLQVSKKPRQIPVKLRRKLNIQVYSPKQLVNLCHGHIMKEMQRKYAGLDGRKKDFGENTYKKLIQEVGRVVYQRLAEIMKNGIDNLNTTFQLTMAYRKKHPHFGDFQLILSTLHKIQDAEGKPRLHIQENELTTIRVTTSMIDNIPVEKVRAACNTYIEKITGKVLEHVKNLKMEVSPDIDPIEAAATIKVREQMGKLTPYLPDIIRQVVNKQFIPEQSSSSTVLIYGEPFLPGKELTKPWLRRLRAFTVTRDPNMFNLLSARVPREALMSVLAADGTLVGGSKMTIRPCDVPFLKTCVSLYEDESEQLSDQLGAVETMAVDGPEEEWTEEW